MMSLIFSLLSASLTSGLETSSQSGPKPSVRKASGKLCCYSRYGVHQRSGGGQCTYRVFRENVCFDPSTGFRQPSTNELGAVIYPETDWDACPYDFSNQPEGDGRGLPTIPEDLRRDSGLGPAPYPANPACLYSI